MRVYISLALSEWQPRTAAALEILSRREAAPGSHHLEGLAVNTSRRALYGILVCTCSNYACNHVHCPMQCLQAQSNVAHTAFY